MSYSVCVLDLMTSGALRPGKAIIYRVVLILASKSSSLLHPLTSTPAASINRTAALTSSVLASFLSPVILALRLRLSRHKAL